MRTYKRLVVLDLDFERLRGEFVEEPRTYGRLYVLLQAQVAERRGKARWGDKSLNIEKLHGPHPHRLPRGSDPPHDPRPT